MKLKFSGLGSLFGGPFGALLGYQTDKTMDTAARQAKNESILAQMETADQMQAIEDAKAEIENAKANATAQRRAGLMNLTRTRFSNTALGVAGGANAGRKTLLGE